MPFRFIAVPPALPSQPFYFSFSFLLYLGLYFSTFFPSHFRNFLLSSSFVSFPFFTPLSFLPLSSPPVLPFLFPLSHFIPVFLPDSSPFHFWKAWGSTACCRFCSDLVIGLPVCCNVICISKYYCGMVDEDFVKWSCRGIERAPRCSDWGDLKR